MFRLKTSQTNKLQKEVLDLIAHSLRTPTDDFAASVGSFRNVQPDKELYDELFSCAMNYVSSSRYLTENVLSLANQLLALQEPVTQYVMPSIQADLVILSVKYQCLPAKVTIKNKIPAGPQLRLNLPVFEFVFRNLLTLAIKYCAPYGTIETGMAAGAGTGTFFVCDSSSRFSPSLFDKMNAICGTGINRAARADASLRGVAFCAEVLKTVKGSIGGDHTDCGGAVFYFSMPAGFL